MENSNTNYRDKYRRVLAEQERMEKQFKFQLDALRTTIMHLSAAAQGLDKQLDASLILLKEKMRGASGQQVLEQMERVQQAAGEYEHSRQSSSAQLVTQMATMVEGLRALQIPQDLKASLKSYSAGLKSRLESYRNYPDVLQELAKLQALALECAANPPNSLWQRLKGGVTLKSAEQKPSTQKNASVSTAEAEIDVAQEFESVEDEEMDLTPQEGEIIKAGEEENFVDPGDEESYYKVAQRIGRTLENLIARIEPNDMVKHKIDIVRMRIQRGMDWYVLAVTLEDIRDILLLRYLQNDQEFSEYLKHVNDELKAISTVLGLASKQDEDFRQSSENFSEAVSDQVNKMRSNMNDCADLDSLKGAVSDHLSIIQGALVKHNKTSTTEPRLSEQLQSLIARVQNIESESEKTKELLEEERYRATHDTLTGLPNREAYNERAHQELQRFKRYCRPLTLAVCDIDHFKNINDSYGHQAGDKVLKLIAKLMSTRLRKVDFIGRYGGEEFVMLMPETPANDALKVLDKIRAVIAKTPFQFKGEPVSITISFGLAVYEPEDLTENVFERADQALYKAKNQGRNQCVIAEETVKKGSK